jgi:hypothetical protein
VGFPVAAHQRPATHIPEQQEGVLTNLKVKKDNGRCLKLSLNNFNKNYIVIMVKSKKLKR